MAEKPVLGYWNIRGLAQPLRLLLAYTGTEFEDKRYDVGPPPDFSRDAWMKEKFNLGLGEWPNLPYFIDGDAKVVETNAIFRYIAKRYGSDICGKTDEEKTNCDMMEMIVYDLRNGFVRLCYNPNFAALRTAYVEELKETKLPRFSRFLAEKVWLCGDTLTYPDFHFYEMLDQHLLFEPSCLDGLDNLKAYHQRFSELPSIKAYLESDRCLKRPVNNTMAAWK